MAEVKEGPKASPITFKPTQQVSFAQAAFNSAVVNSKPTLTVEQAEDINEELIPFRILISALPEGGKTHFLCTFPSPIVIIDTENRYKLIVKKFRTCNDCGKHWVSINKHPKTGKICGIIECPHCGSKNTKIKDIRGIRCHTSKEAREAAKLAIKILDDHFEKTGQIGTIGVDNVSKVWDKTQHEYEAEKNLAINEKVLDPMSDYKHINPRHNEEFRDLLLGSRHNIVLIATRKDIYSKENRFEIVGTAAEGQKHNPYAVDWEISNEQGKIILSNGKPVGNGIFTSYIIKNSYMPGSSIDPIQNLDYERLFGVRRKLLQACGIVEMPSNGEMASTPSHQAKNSGENKQ